MRPQYHLRPSPRGLLAWDMRKIIATYGHLPPEPVALSDIPELDNDWWFGTHGTPTPRAIADHMQMVQSVDRSFPIILDAQGRLMDGMHRIVQALLAGETSILAIRLPETPPPDFVNVQPDALPYHMER